MNDNRGSANTHIFDVGPADFDFGVAATSISFRFSQLVGLFVKKELTNYRFEKYCTNGLTE